MADRNGDTALHVLLGTIGDTPPPELEAMLRLLAAHGARADTADRRGTTPAQLADGGLSEVRAIFRTVYPPATSATGAATR